MGLEGFSQSLAQEVAAFGIKVTLVEPTGFSTDWSGPSAAHAEPLPAYADYREQVQAMRKARIGTPGDPGRERPRDPQGRGRRRAAAARLLRRRPARPDQGREEAGVARYAIDPDNADRLWALSERAIGRRLQV